MNEGDKIRGISFDTSDGGNLDLIICAKITEFDAYEYVSPPITRPFPEKPDVQERPPRDPKM